jgi:hypothetical protein
MHLAPEVACHPHQMPSFGLIHRCLGGFHVARRSRFYFDDAQNLAVPADQIEFPAMMWRTKIASYDGLTAPPKIEISFFLAPPASGHIQLQRHPSLTACNVM